MITKLYPFGKRKAFNISYDDGVLQDVRFVNLLNKYGLKGTFNLNSGLLETEYEWTHDNGSVIKRLPISDVVSIYKGHEVASHTLTHPFMHELSKEDILYQLSSDKTNLEKIFHRQIRGFAIPFDYCSDLIVSCAKECDFDYMRISDESLSFNPPTNFHRWASTIFHCRESLKQLTNEFINCSNELALYQIAGHSYDLDVENKWDDIEEIFKAISTQPDILPMTHIEMVEYLTAMNSAIITENGIENNSSISLWFDINGKICEIKPTT